MTDPTPPSGRFLKLAPHFYVMWLVLWFLLATKVFFLRETTSGDYAMIGAMGVVMIILSYLGAWAAWAFSGKNRRTGEIAFLVILTILFLIPTIGLYVEAMGARD